MIQVWTDGIEAGLLEREQERGSVFAYSPEAQAARAVSLTMPVQLASWKTPYGLPPVFEMNLPEGALRERLLLGFAKAAGRFDDIDLLAITGRSQLGRIRYTGRGDTLDDEVPFQDVREILARGRDGNLFQYLIDKFARYSGVSGVQPKFLVRDESALARAKSAGFRQSPNWRGATHIVKLWDAGEFPHLAANEYFCLKAAGRCGLAVPRFQLADDGAALVIDRFDLQDGRAYQGFEDFCVLNANSTAEKYRGSYETALFKRFGQFASPRDFSDDLRRLFTLFVLNCALRNGDAHLKNFGVVYNAIGDDVRLAPVYDLVTTTVYIPGDTMALTLNGTTRWPAAKDLIRFGETRVSLTPAQARQVLEQVADALSLTARDLRRYRKQHPAFAPIGEAMLREWAAATALSLQ